MIPVKGKKQKVVINPENVLAFEVTDEDMQTFYAEDEYKYLIHYIRAFPEGRVPIMQYLLIRFHPLIIKVSGRYVKVLDMEWRDLISFTRCKFIELIYRFKLRSSLYFRTYIETALRRAVYDRVLYETRRKSLLAAQSVEEIHNNAESHPLPAELTCQAENPHEDLKGVLHKINEFVLASPEVTAQDKIIYGLRFIEGNSLQETCKKLKLPSFVVVDRQKHIRKVLQEYAKKCLV